LQLSSASYRLIIDAAGTWGDAVFHKHCSLPAAQRHGSQGISGPGTEGRLRPPALRLALPLGSTRGECCGKARGRIGRCRGATAYHDRVSAQSSAAFHFRTAFGGWRGGILPAESPVPVVQGNTMPLAAMLSAAYLSRFRRIGTGLLVSLSAPVQHQLIREALHRRLRPRS